MKKKSILMLMSTYQKTSGHTRVIDNLSEFLMRDGYDVSIGALTFQKDPPKNVKQVNLTYTNVKSILKNYDIIHNHQTKMNYYSLFSTKPFVFQYHGASTKLQKINLYVSLLLCRKKIAKIVTVSRSSINQLPKFAQKNNVQTIYNGINTEFYDMDLKLENKTANDPQLLFTGNLFKYKNIQLIIKSLKKLKIKYPNIQLVIVGDGEFREDLEKLVKNSNLSENVSLLGRISDEKLREQYLISNIYVSASTFETFGMPLVESMACEKPVVVSDIPAHNELIKESEAGACFSLDDDDDFVAKVELVYGNRHNFGMNGKKFADKLNWKNIVKEYGKTYDQLV